MISVALQYSFHMFPFASEPPRIVSSEDEPLFQKLDDQCRIFPVLRQEAKLDGNGLSDDKS